MRENQSKERGERFVSQNRSIRVYFHTDQNGLTPLKSYQDSPHRHDEIACRYFLHLLHIPRKISPVCHLCSLHPVKNFHTCKSIQHGKNYRTTCENILLLPLVIPLSVILRHHTPVNISLPPRRISPVSKLYPIHTPENFSALLRKISPVYPGRFLLLIDKVIDHTIDPPLTPQGEWGGIREWGRFSKGKA